MAFKMKSGNKVSFKNMGSSPAKQYKKPTGPIAEIKPEEKLAKPMTNEEMMKAHDISAHITEGSIETQALRRKENKKQAKSKAKMKAVDKLMESPAKQKSKMEIKQKSKTDKQKARGGDTPGGRRVTRAESDMVRDDKLNEQLARANTLEAAGKGEKGFSWKEAGMSVLRGEGLIGNIASGMGKGRYKSEIIKDKQTKIAGKKERKTIATKQKDERKAARKLKKQSMVSKIRKASNLNTDILDD